MKGPNDYKKKVAEGEAELASTELDSTQNIKDTLDMKIVAVMGVNFT